MTGTGKTAAFVVPAIEQRIKAIEAHGRQAVKDAGMDTDKQLETRAKRVFARQHAGALIISPTRELATQIANEASRLSTHHLGFEVRTFLGGSSKGAQLREWMRGRRDLVVATPGRLRDVLMSEPEVAKGLSRIPMVVLDEADTLLDMGFRDDLQAIMEYLPSTPQRQTFLFSATVSKSIQQIAREVLDKNHVFINCATDVSPVHAHVAQYHTVLPEASEQIPHVLRLLAHDQLTNPGRSKTVVFLPTTKQTQLFATIIREIARKVLPAGRSTRVYEMHSKRNQGARTTTSDAFRNDKSGASILVTSDVSARGVDYPGVTRVIQVGIPPGTDVYIHRVGRTGRAGSMGRGDLVLLPWESSFVTWQMSDVPLKSVSTAEIQSQVEAMSKTFDADPEDYFKDVETSAGGFDTRGRGRSPLPTVFPAPYAPAVSKIDEQVKNLLEGVDEEAVTETLMASLGYYVGRAHELRLDKRIIVDGLKTWSQQALGLLTPPYISESFLAKLGMSSRKQDRWSGRGGQVRRPRQDDRGYTPRGDRTHDSREFGGYQRRESRSGSYSRQESGSAGYERRESSYGGFGRRDSDSRRARNQS